MLICTPRWLLEHVPKVRYVFARHYLIVDRYDYDLICACLEKKFYGVAGSTWSDVAERLARYGHWEFEDYQPHVETSA